MTAKSAPTANAAGGAREHAQGETREYASSPCYAHELAQPELTGAPLLDMLNELIEGERAGAQGLIEMAHNATRADLQGLLREVANDEARYCAMLSRHVVRLGGQASRVTGRFAEKLAGRPTLEAKLALLDKGQSVVVKVLEEAIPRLTDRELQADLIEMRDVHVRNIARCAEPLPPEA